MNKEFRIMDWVPRWGITPRHQNQTVASHSLFVAIYTADICRLIEADNYSRLYCIEYALIHDTFEVWTSDPPGPAKRSLYDKDKESAYHARFVEQMGALYGAMHNCKSFPCKTPLREYLVKDIVKLGDIIDSLFYLRIETLRGNLLMDPLFHREYERFELVLEGFHPTHSNLIREQVEKHLPSVLDKDSLVMIPAMNLDLEEFKKHGI